MVVGEVLNRPHRVDEVEAVSAKWQRAHVGEGKARPPWPIEIRGLARCGERDVDAEWPRTLISRPAQDLGVLGLIPEIRLEQRAALQIWEELLEQLALTLDVIGSR